MSIEKYGTVIYKVYSGSRSYGTNIDEEKAKELVLKHGGNVEDYLSDVDIRGIFIPFDEYLYGPNKIDEYRDPNEEDTVYFSLEKFIRLAIECNPNVVEQLFVNEEHIIYMNDFGKKLYELRNIFLTKNAFGSFASYAFAQLKRIKNRTEGFNRNQHRQTLINNAGGDWDPKNAMHLVRLLYMVKQILGEGTLNTYCSFKDLLLKIRNAEMTYEEVISLADDLFLQIEESLLKSTIPDFPDTEFINNWLIDITAECNGNDTTYKKVPNDFSILPKEFKMFEESSIFLISNPLVRKTDNDNAIGLVIPSNEWFSGMYEFNEFKYNNLTLENFYKFIEQTISCKPKHIEAIFSSEEYFIFKGEKADLILNFLKKLPTSKKAFYTAKNYFIGNINKMKKWEEEKKQHNNLREKIIEAKKVPLDFYKIQIKVIEDQLILKQSSYEENLNKLYSEIIEIKDNEGLNLWREKFELYDKEAKGEIISLKIKKEKLEKEEIKWLEFYNKKGNLSFHPPVASGTPSENASVIGRFSYDTILASHIYYYLSIFTELLETGTVENSKKYIDIMYSIQRGKFKSFDQFEIFANDLFNKLQEANNNNKKLKEDLDFDYLLEARNIIQEIIL